MKTEILKILQMERDGKLTQEQAAQLLAMLADQARENDSGSRSPGNGASGPRGEGSEEVGAGGAGDAGAKRTPGGGSFADSAANTLHDIVDTAVGVGASVGRAATVIGGEIFNRVHRKESGNSITLSKVREPVGHDFVFDANSFNVSKVAEITLDGAEFTHNSVNISDITQVRVSQGRFAQCSVGMSSISDVTIQGHLNVANEGAAETQGAGGEAAAPLPTAQSALRGCTLNATKFSRVRLLAGSQLDACVFITMNVKELELANGSAMRDSRFTDSALASVGLDGSTASNVAIERSKVQSMKATGSTLEHVTFHSTRIEDLTLSGSHWNNVSFRRSLLGTATAGGNRESAIRETTFDHCTLANCSFLGCTFRRTTLRNINLAGATIRNVDFTGLTLESDEAFRKAAGV